MAHAGAIFDLRDMVLVKTRRPRSANDRCHAHLALWALIHAYPGRFHVRVSPMDFPAVSGAQKGTGEGRGGHCVYPVDLLFLGLPWPFRALHGRVSSVVGVARGGAAYRIEAMLNQHRPDQLLRLCTVCGLCRAPRSTPATARHASQHDRQLHVDDGPGVLARVAGVRGRTIYEPRKHGTRGLSSSSWRTDAVVGAASLRRRVPTEVIDLIWPDSCRNGQSTSQPVPAG